MFYVGLDIHAKHIAICVLNETGQFVHRSQVRTIDQMMRILEGLPDRFEVCYEASCGYGHFHDLLNDVDKEKVMSDVQAWLDARIPSAAPAGT